jgi:F0F1-type ATP synthase delta subunit
MRRAKALVEIAEEMARVGKVEQAMEVFNQALRVAEGIEEADGRAWALREIAEGMASVGKVEQAMEVFNQALRVAEGIEGRSGAGRALG